MYFRKLCLLVILSALVPSTLAQTSIAVEYLLTPVAELGEVYACVVNDVNYSEVGESIVITGDHTEGRSNSAVQALLFQSGVLIGIPNQFFSVYQNLQKLTVSSMGLRSISQETFIGASNLRHVEITGNPITGLTAQTFSRSNRIETVDLSNNQIFNVANNTFAGLLFLRKINLANNHISSIDSTLNTLFNLAELDLSGNNLAIVSPLAFGGMISLKTLRLTDNSFFYIHPDSFRYVRQLIIF